MQTNGCKHYNGYFHNDTCDAGIVYRDVTPDPDEPGSGYRKPCIVVDDAHGLSVLRDYGPQGTCSEFTEYAAEEIAELENAIHVSRNRMQLTLHVIGKVKRDHKGKGWSGVVECPVCGGELSLSHAASNGHVWGSCKTEGCVSWME